MRGTLKVKQGINRVTDDMESGVEGSAFWVGAEFCVDPGDENFCKDF